MEIYRVFVGVATNVQVLHNRARLFSIAGLPDAGAHLPATHARDGPEGRTPDDGRATPADIRGDGDHCRAGAHRATLAPDAVEPETASDPGAPALSDATPDVGAQPSCCTHRLAPRHPRRLKLQRGGYGIRGKREGNPSPADASGFCSIAAREFCPLTLSLRAMPAGFF